MNKTQKVSCTCQNTFQDQTYGKGIRITTPCNNEQMKKNFVVRCTVCKKEHNLGMLK